MLLQLWSSQSSVDISPWLVWKPDVQFHNLILFWSISQRVLRVGRKQRYTCVGKSSQIIFNITNNDFRSIYFGSQLNHYLSSWNANVQVYIATRLCKFVLTTCRFLCWWIHGQFSANILRGLLNRPQTGWNGHIQSICKVSTRALTYHPSLWILTQNWYLVPLHVCNENNFKFWQVTWPRNTYLRSFLTNYMVDLTFPSSCRGTHISLSIYRFLDQMEESPLLQNL